jgi:asparagine synthase (glutamine-hydrolysing)
MCGIAGIIGPDRKRVTDSVARVTAAQAHRGPDDSGQEVVPFGAGWVGLGHRRLSILDLSPLGHQPMSAAPDGPWLCYNGEIYNFAEVRGDLIARGYTFRSTGDTEVLLAALREWGAAALPRLRGMYALAYCDPARERLLLARDPAGIKPLYLAEGDGYLAFASEVRAVLASGVVKPTIDRRGVAGYLAYGAVQHPHTLFQGVRSLPPGSHQEFAAVAGGGWSAVAPPVPFWSYPTPRPTADPVGRVQAAVEGSVREHLISDVPVGVFLSSGIDSTVVAGLAGRLSPGVQGFTVAFADEPTFDESTTAAETARRFGLKFEPVSLTAAEAEAAVNDWLGAIDQPSMDGLNVYVIARAVRGRGIKVALSGQGGDELFGGYPSFRDVPRVRRLTRVLRPLPAVARRGVAGVLTYGKPTSVRAKLRDMVSGNGGLTSLYLHRRRLMSDPQMAALGLRADDLGLTADYLQPETTPELADVADDAVATVSRLESAYYQGNMLLRDGDANGMASGLEVRLPFLGQQVMDLAHSIPGRDRLPPGGGTKYLLRAAFPELLRDEVVNKTKMGFTLPIRRWMRTTLRPRCEAAIATLKALDLLAPAGVDAVVREFEAEPDSPSWTRAFALCVLGDFVGRHL